MNDLMEAVGPLLVIAVAVVMYVLVMQVVNDPACAAMDRSVTPIVGKGLIKLLALCWW